MNKTDLTWAYSIVGFNSIAPKVTLKLTMSSEPWLNCWPDLCVKASRCTMKFILPANQERVFLCATTSWMFVRDLLDKRFVWETVIHLFWTLSGASAGDCVCVSVCSSAPTAAKKAPKQRPQCWLIYRTWRIPNTALSTWAATVTDVFLSMAFILPNIDLHGHSGRKCRKVMVLWLRFRI